MTVVSRELVTRLSFRFDRTNLDRFERAILGFRSNISSTTSVIRGLSNAAGLFLSKKGLDFFGDIATAVLDVNEFARGLGQSTERFIALQKAAEQFRFKNFAGAFSGIGKALEQYRHGLGGLVEELSRISGRKLNLAPFAQTRDIEGATNAILAYGKSLGDTVEAGRLFSKAFGEENAAGAINVINKTSDALSRGADGWLEYAKSIVANKDQFEKFDKDLKVFYANLTQLTVEFGGVALPIINGLVTGLTTIVRSISGKPLSPEKRNELIENNKKSAESNRQFIFDLGKAFGVGLYEYAKSSGIPIGDMQAPSLFGGLRKSFFEDFVPYVENREPVNVTNNNNFDILMPPGTTEGQVNHFTQQIKMILSGTMNEIVRDVISNNPQYEQ